MSRNSMKPGDCIAGLFWDLKYMMGINDAQEQIIEIYEKALNQIAGFGNDIAREALKDGAKARKLK